MKRAVFLVVLALLTSRPLFAQSTTEGAIGGLVVDQSKGVLPGATVNARNVGTNSTASATTDESGHFTVIRLQPGTYELSCFVTSPIEGQPRNHHAMGMHVLLTVTSA